MPVAVSGVGGRAASSLAWSIEDAQVFAWGGTSVFAGRRSVFERGSGTSVGGCALHVGDASATA
eukprot:4555511-Heterocapsa_arctica.AAC.1